MTFIQAASMWPALKRGAGALAALTLIFVAPSSVTSTLAADQPWLDAKLADAAKQEGTLVIYSAINEREGLPLSKAFEAATGVKVEYIRASDTQLVARIMLETRGGRPAWDLFLSTAVHKLPQQLVAQIDPPEAQHLFPEARDPERRWYGQTSNYDLPAYNTKFASVAELPKTYEELAQRTAWAGRVAINESDSEWLIALLRHYGESKGRQLVRDLAQNLKPAIVSGHLALARAVGAGEYGIALNNFLNLTMNVKLTGAPTDFWVIDPIGVYYAEVGVNARAPHPNAARLAANFMLSREAMSILAKFGRIPTRADVETNPPGVLKALQGRKVMPILLKGDEEKQADKLFKELVTGRTR